MNRDDDQEVNPNEIPSADEREILRYYYYIKYGVDTIHVAPLDQRVLNTVRFKIYEKILDFKQYLRLKIVTLELVYVKKL